MEPMPHFGVWSLLPAVVTIGLALWSKRVIESLLAGLAVAVFIVSAGAQGWAVALLRLIPNIFQAIVGKNLEGEIAGVAVRSYGIVDNAGNLVMIALLGIFITILDRSGGVMAFGAMIGRRAGGRRGAELGAAAIGTSVFTSAYFSALATGTIMRPIFDRLKISREKLAFYCDSTSAPINTLVPISGWVVFLIGLLGNVLDVDGDGAFLALVRTIPVNFYCWIALLSTYLLALGILPDLGPMRRAERRIRSTGELFPEGARPMVQASKQPVSKEGTVSDLTVPLGLTISLLVILGLWKYTAAPLWGFPGLGLSAYDILNGSFAAGIITAAIKYRLKRLMSGEEIFETLIEGSKFAIVGAIIIVLATTLSSFMRNPAPHGLGTALYVIELTAGAVPTVLIPLLAFVLSAALAFAMGTSWGVWAMMLPMAVPLALGAGGSGILTAAAVLSGGTFGDHCSPISDTTVMSSIAAEVDHIDHVRTQLPYALLSAALAAILFLVAGFFGQ